MLSATRAQICQLTPPAGGLSLLPTADGLVVTPTADTRQIIVDGQSGINAYGLTSPSNILTLRDLRNLTPFVVGPDPTDSEFQTVAAAVAAATAPGSAGAVIIIKDNPNGYVNEVFDVSVGDVTLVGTSTALSTLVNPTITLSATGTVTFQNLTLSGGTVTVGATSTGSIVSSVLTGGVVVTSTGNLQLLNSLAPSSTINLLSGSQNSITDSQLQNLTVQGIAGELIIRNSSFVNAADLTFTDLPAGIPTIILNSSINLGTLTLTSPVSPASILILAATSLRGGTVTVGPQTGFFLNNAGTQGTRFAPFPRFSIVQIVQTSMAIDRPLRFQGQSSDFQTMRWCNVSNSSTGPADFAPQNALISVESSAPGVYRAYLRTDHLSLDAGASNPGGQSCSVINLDTGDIVLYSATMISLALQYALDGGGAGGTIVRPSTTDNLGAFHGTNLIQGTAAVAAGVTVTDSNPWTATIGTVTWNLA